MDSTPFRGAIRMGDWKLVRNGEATAIGEETWELFALKNDPFENIDLKSKRPETFQKLRKKLQELARQAVTPNMPPNRLPAEFNVPKVW